MAVWCGLLLGHSLQWCRESLKSESFGALKQHGQQRVAVCFWTNRKYKKYINKICIKVFESLWIFSCCCFDSMFVLQVFHQDWICYTVSLGFAGIQSYGGAKISCPWANKLLHFWPSDTKRCNLCCARQPLIQGSRREDNKEHGGNVWVPLRKG